MSCVCGVSCVSCMWRGVSGTGGSRSSAQGCRAVMSCECAVHAPLCLLPTTPCTHQNIAKQTNAQRFKTASWPCHKCGQNSQTLAAQKKGSRAKPTPNSAGDPGRGRMFRDASTNTANMAPTPHLWLCYLYRLLSCRARSSSRISPSTVSISGTSSPGYARTKGCRARERQRARARCGSTRHACVLLCVVWLH